MIQHGKSSNIRIGRTSTKGLEHTRFKRAPRAIQIIRDEVIRHLKVLPEEEIYIDPSVNEKIWERGIENPPRKIRLTVIRHDEPDIPIEVKLFEEA